MERPDPEHPNFSKMARYVEDEMEWVKPETDSGDVILFANPGT